MSNIIPYNEIERMAISTAKSGLFGLKSEHQAVAIMMIAQAENMHPMRAVMEYDIIGGKPALKSTAVLARFQQAGGKIEWIESTDKKAIAKFTHDQGGSITIEWTIERAKTAGVYGTNDVWKKYPNQMLRARCIPEGVRAVYPACLSGMYSSDEVADFTKSQVISIKEETIEDVEIIIKEPNYKKIVVDSLKEMGLTDKEIKAFAEKHDLANDKEKLIELSQNEDALSILVVEFEREIEK